MFCRNLNNVKMKTFFLIFSLILVSSACFSQDCDAILKKKYDKFEDRTIIESASGVILHDKDGFPLAIRLFSLDSSAFSFLFAVGDGIRMRGGESIVFIMEDGERRSFSNGASVNYQGRAMCSIFLNSPKVELLELFSTKLVSSLKVDFMEVEVPIELAKKLRSHVICMKSTLNR